MRSIIAMLLLVNGIYFGWHLLTNQSVAEADHFQAKVPASKQPLQLLSEVAVKPSSESVRAEQVEAVVAVASSDASASDGVLAGSLSTEIDEESGCWLVGPMDDEVAAKQVESRLSSEGLGGREILLSVPQVPVHWVYVPPFATRKQALAQLRELQQQGVDSFVITEGEFANGISLGFYSSEESAKQVQSERQSLGVAVQVREKERFKEQIWFVLAEQESLELDDAMWERIRSGSNFLQKHKKACESIASLKNIE